MLLPGSETLPSFARWWLPDDIVFVPELPRTGVGKLDKKVLRDQYRDYAVETAAER